MDPGYRDVSASTRVFDALWHSAGTASKFGATCEGNLTPRADAATAPDP